MSKLLFFEARQEELSRFAQDVEDGNINPLIAYANIKKLEAEISLVKKQIEPLAIDEAVSYGEKSFEAFGMGFEIRNGATRYSYKNIDKWIEKQKEIKDIESQSKQAFISKQKGMITATSDGEEIQLPEVNYSKDSLIVK